MNVAVIPARGGSKRIPNKNIKLFHGRPIIEYSIAAAKESGLFEKIVVSTDSESIAAVARAMGAEVPALRPAELSDDHTPTAPVVQHALRGLIASGLKPQYALCLYPTAPFVRAADVREAHQRMIAAGATGAFSVTTFGFPIFRALKIDPEGKLRMFWPEHELTRSNDLPAAYHDAGQFYWVEVESFMRDGKMWAVDAVPLILPRYRCQDIDTPEDWEMAELLFQVQPK